MDGFEASFEDLAKKGYAYRKKRLEAEALARKQAQKEMQIDQLVITDDSGRQMSVSTQESDTSTESWAGAIKNRAYNFAMLFRKKNEFK